jgi:hypothetical protein
VADNLRPYIPEVSFPDHLAWLVVELDLRSIYWQYPEGDPKSIEMLKHSLESWEELIKRGESEPSLLSLKKLGTAAVVVVVDMSPESVVFQCEEQSQWEGYRQEWRAMNYLPEEPGFHWKESWDVSQSVEKQFSEGKNISNASIEKLTERLGGANVEGNQASNFQTLLPSIALWGVSERIADRAELLPPDQRFMSRAALGELEKIITNCSQSTSWKSAPIDRMERLRWRLGAIGEGRVEALAAVDQQIVNQPRSAAWQRTKALLLETGSKDDLEQALEIYRRLASGAKVGSDEWMRARYRSALCLLWMGEKDGAVQTAEVIKLTHPPQHSVWQNRWNEILRLKP